MLVAEIAGGEYAFLDLTTAAFDLTDRGVKGREAPGPLDAFAYTERGVYRPGERCTSPRWCATAPARRRACPSPSSSRVPTASSTRASR